MKTKLVATKSGMVREPKDQKLNFLDYFSPDVIERFGRHMKIGELKHGRGNWAKGGYPKHEYLESLFRHFLALWQEENGSRKRGAEDHAAALAFNIFGFMHEDITAQQSRNLPSVDKSKRRIIS